MREQSAIRNPLTVIAIFAGIAEVSGTVVLPLLDACSQATFMWFVMGFPCLLVLMFFATLWKKHEVLYAPSDFRDDSGFLEAQRRRIENAALHAKFIEDTEFAVGTTHSSDSQAEEPEPAAHLETPQPPPATTPVHPVRPLEATPTPTRVARGTYLLAERAVLNRLEKELPGEYKRDTVLTIDDTVYAFDATFQEHGMTIGVDVKYVQGVNFNKGLLRTQLSKLDSFYKKMPPEAQRGFKMILAVATDAPYAEQLQILKDVDVLAQKFAVPIEVRVYDLSVLEGELGGR